MIFSFKSFKQLSIDSTILSLVHTFKKRTIFPYKSYTHISKTIRRF